jgi:hypothetical protein
MLWLMFRRYFFFIYGPYLSALVQSQRREGRMQSCADILPKNSRGTVRNPRQPVSGKLNFEARRARIIYFYLCAHACMSVLCINICTYVFLYMFMHVCMYVCLYVPMFQCIKECVPRIICMYLDFTVCIYI